MDHINLHNQMSKLLSELQEGTVDTKLAREYFNGAGKLIANCKNELIAASMGAELEIPLLGISSKDMRPSKRQITT